MRPLTYPLEPAGTRRLATLSGLINAQEMLANLGRPTARTELVTVPRAVGRISAACPEAGQRESIAAEDGRLPACGLRIPPGTRLDVRHLPLLSDQGAAMTRVFARVRVGVITLLGDPAANGVARETPAVGTITGTTIAGLVEQLGAQAFEATCRPDAPGSLAKTLGMFLGECDLVLFCGFLTPAQSEIVRQTLALRDAAVSIETLHLRPVGALQLVRSGAKLAIALSADLGSAFSAFVLLLSPLIRGLQGRSVRVPGTRIAELVAGDAAAWGLAQVREDGPSPDRVLLHPCIDADAIAAIAGASGYAWRPVDLSLRGPRSVAYYPFAHWLS